MLEIKDVTKTFKGVTAISGVTLALGGAPGVYGLIGPNGAGKTTMVNLMTGYSKPDSGSIAFDGVDVTRTRPERLVALGISRTYQNIRLFEGMTVKENIELGRHRFLGRGLAGLVRRRGADDKELIADLIDRLALGGVAGEFVEDLSYGTRRRVEIARALATGCSLLILDEPVAGMTAAEAASIGSLLRDLVRDGMEIVLVEHNIAMVTEVCDELAVLNWGAVIAQGPPSEVWANTEVQEAYLGRKGVRDKEPRA